MSSSLSPVESSDVELMDFGDRHAIAMLISTKNLPVLDTHQPAYLGTRGAEVWLLQDLLWANIQEDVVSFEIYSPDMELLVRGPFTKTIGAGKSCRVRASKLIG